jgi:predicted amidohydrolase
MQSHRHPYYQSVFLAPEYYFSNQRHSNDRFFSQDVKRYIVSRLRTLARQYPEILIIPGTVLWKKNAFSGVLTLGKPGEGLKRQQTQKSVDRVNKTLNRIVNARAQFNTTSNFPGWSHSGQFGRNPDSYNTEHNEDKFFMPKHYLENAKDLNTEIAQNVAYIFKDDVVLKYHKVGNFQEVMNEQSNIVFAPGNITGLFKVGGVPYGIEVCRDHAQGVLSGSLQNVNIHIIISSWIANTPVRTALTNGGVLLHSSTKKTTVNANIDPIQFKDNSAKLVASKSVGALAQLWVIDLDDQACGINNTFSERLTSDTMLAAG